MPAHAKICGLTTPETIDAAIAHGPRYVRLNFFAPSPRYLPLDRAAGIAARIPSVVGKVGIFVDPDDALIDAAIATGRLDAVQIHKAQPDRLAAIRRHIGIPVWAALAVKTRADLAEAPALVGAADFILFDAKTPDDAALPGGMGVRFDWAILKQFRPPLPWGLSGGLTPANVADAIRETAAPMVDVSSGVETAPGVKDPALIADFLRAVGAR